MHRNISLFRCERLSTITRVIDELDMHAQMFSFD